MCTELLCVKPGSIPNGDLDQMAALPRGFLEAEIGGKMTTNG